MIPVSGQSTDRLAPLFERIARGKFEPVYVLFGADSCAAEEVIRRLREKVIKPGFDAFDFEGFHAEDTPVVQALQHARQPAVGSARRLVIIRGVDGLRKTQRAELCEGLKRLAEADNPKSGTGSTVVLTCDYDKALQEMFADAGLLRYVVDLRQPGTGDLLAMLGRWAEDAGITIEPAAGRMLLEVAGDDTAVLRSEMEKLFASVEPGTRVTPEMVRRLAGRSRDFELKEYVDNLVKGKTAVAVLVLERLAAWGEAPQVIISWLTNSLLWLLSDLARGRQVEAAASLNPEYLRRCLQQLYEINRAILTGHPEPFVLLQTFTLCAACPGIGQGCGLARGSSDPEFCVRRDRKRAAKRRVNA